MRRGLGVFLWFFLAACNNKDSEVKVNYYFDLESFFENEAKKLKSQNPRIHKEVRQNNETEARTLKISNWETELDLFKSSDINKPAWKNSYRIVKTKGKTAYISVDKSLKTQLVEIYYKSTLVSRISINNLTSNILYKSAENLTYYPDSLYLIKKTQKVILLGANAYTVKGTLKQTSNK
jgi:hypothetical protein